MSVQPESEFVHHFDPLEQKETAKTKQKKPGYFSRIVKEAKLITQITTKLKSDHQIKDSHQIAQLIDTALHAALEHPKSDTESESDEYPSELMEEERTPSSMEAMRQVVENNHKHPGQILDKLKPAILEAAASNPKYSLRLPEFEQYLSDVHLQSIAEDLKNDKRIDYGKFYVDCLIKACGHMDDMAIFLKILDSQKGDLEMGFYELMQEYPWDSDVQLISMAEKLSLMPDSISSSSSTSSTKKRQIPSPKDLTQKIVMPSFKEIVNARETDKVAQVVSKKFLNMADKTKTHGITIEPHKNIEDFEEIRERILKQYKDEPLKAAAALKKAALILLARDPYYNIAALDIMKMSLAMDKHIGRAKKYYNAAGKSCSDYQRFCGEFQKISHASLEQYANYMQGITDYEKERMEAKDKLGREIALTMNQFIPGSGDTASALDVDRWVATLTTDFMERADMKQFTEDTLNVLGKFMDSNATVLQKLNDDLSKGVITREQFNDPKAYQDLVMAELDKMGMRHPAAPLSSGKTSPEEERFFNALSKAVLNQILQAYPTAGKILNQQIIHDLITPHLIELVNQETQPILFYQRLLFVLEKINKELAVEQTSSDPSKYEGQGLQDTAKAIARFTAASLQSETDVQSTGPVRRSLFKTAESAGISTLMPYLLEKQGETLLARVEQMKGLELVNLASDSLKLFREMREKNVGSLSDNPELARALEKELVELISKEVQQIVKAKAGAYIESADIARDMLVGATITAPLALATYGTAGGIRGTGLLGGLLVQGTGFAAKKTTEAYYMLSNGLNSLWGQSSEAYEQASQKALLESIDNAATHVARQIYSMAETAAKKAEETGQPLIEAMAKFHEEHASQIEEMIAKEVDTAVKGQLRHLGNQGVLKNLMYQIITDAAVNSFLPDQRDNFHREWGYGKPT